MSEKVKGVKRKSSSVSEVSGGRNNYIYCHRCNEKIPMASGVMIGRNIYCRPCAKKIDR